MAAVAMHSSPESKTAGGIMKSAGQVGAQSTAAVLARQVNLFQDLYRRRDQQYANMLAKTHEFTEEADDSEMELVFAMDRAEFAESQLSRLLESAPQTYKVQAQRVSEFQKSARAVANHLKMEDEIHEGHERSAWLISRLRLLRPLCQLSDQQAGQYRTGLSSLLQQCEEKLEGTCTDGTLDHLTADFSLASPLSAVLSALGQKQCAEDGHGDSQEQFLLPALRSPKQLHVTAEEDLRLQREIEELTDRNENLRKELAKESQQHSACEARARAAADVEAQAARESEELQQQTRSLADEMVELQQEVSRLQTELPQLESQAAPVRLQLGCASAEVAAHHAHIVRERAAVPALADKLRKLAPPDSASRARQATLLSLRRELAEAYAALAEAHQADSPQIGHEQSLPDSSLAQEELLALERKLEAARDENVRLKQAAEIGSAQDRSKQREAQNGLIYKVAKNRKLIGDLQDRLQKEKLQEQRLSIRRQDGRSATVPVHRSPTHSPQTPLKSPHSSQGSRSGSLAAPVGSAAVATAVYTGPTHTTSGMPIAVPVVQAVSATPVSSTTAAAMTRPGGGFGSITSASLGSPSALLYAQRYGNPPMSTPSAFDATALEMRPNSSKPPAFQS